MVISSLMGYWKLIETDSKIAKTLLQSAVINSINEVWKIRNFVRFNEKPTNSISSSATIFSQVSLRYNDEG